MAMPASNEPNSRWTALLRWIAPRPGHLCEVPRIVVGALGNAILAIYVAPRASRIGDITAYPHLTANPTWVCAVLGTPLVILMCLLPLYFSKRPAHRWAAVALSLYPALFGLIVGMSVSGQ